MAGAWRFVQRLWMFVVLMAVKGGVLSSRIWFLQLVVDCFDCCVGSLGGAEVVVGGWLTVAGRRQR